VSTRASGAGCPQRRAVGSCARGLAPCAGNGSSDGALHPGAAVHPGGPGARFCGSMMTFACHRIRSHAWPTPWPAPLALASRRPPSLTSGACKSGSWRYVWYKGGTGGLLPGARSCPSPLPPPPPPPQLEPTPPPCPLRAAPAGPRRQRAATTAAAPGTDHRAAAGAVQASRGLAAGTQPRMLCSRPPLSLWGSRQAPQCKPHTHTHTPVVGEQASALMQATPPPPRSASSSPTLAGTLPRSCSCPGRCPSPSTPSGWPTSPSLGALHVIGHCHETSKYGAKYGGGGRRMSRQGGA